MGKYKIDLHINETKYSTWNKIKIPNTNVYVRN